MSDDEQGHDGHDGDGGGADDTSEESRATDGRERPTDDERADGPSGDAEDEDTAPDESVTAGDEPAESSHEDVSSQEDHEQGTSQEEIDGHAHGEENAEDTMAEGDDHAPDEHDEPLVEHAEAADDDPAAHEEAAATGDLEGIEEAEDDDPDGGFTFGTKTVQAAGGASAAVAVESDGTADEDDVVHAEPLDGPVQATILSDVKQYFSAAEPDDIFGDYPDESFIDEQWFDFEYLGDHEEIDRLWVNEPYAYISVLYDESEKEYLYHVNEPALDEFERYVRQDLIDFLRTSLMYEDVSDQGDKAEIFDNRAKELIAEHAATVQEGSLYKLLYYLRRDFIEMGPIDAIMRDPNIEDVSCDGIDVPVFVYHRNYRDLKTNVVFDKQRLNSFTVRLAQRAGKQISVSDPLVDATLPDGSRLQLTLGGDISTRGSNFTIRKFAEVPFTPIDLTNWNTFSIDQMAYFWLCIENNKSLIFAGGTGSGKTTSLNAISFFIPPTSKIVSIEDTREIDLPHQNWIQSVTRDSMSASGRGEITMYQLLQSALRQRPEYIVVGEIRTEQRVALTFFQAMGTGHTCYTTLHADSVEAVLNRLQNPPLSVPMGMIQDLDIVSIQKQQFIEGTRVRRNEQVTEIVTRDGDPNAVRTVDVFRRNAQTDEHEDAGDSQVLEAIAETRGWSQRELREQLRDRQRVLEYLRDNDISDYDSVSSLIMLYNKDPEWVMGQLDAEEPVLAILTKADEEVEQ